MHKKKLFELLAADRAPFNLIRHLVAPVHIDPNLFRKTFYRSSAPILNYTETISDDLLRRILK